MSEPREKINEANNDAELYPVNSMAHGLPISIKRLSDDHPIYLIENFVTGEECDHVVEKGKKLLQPSTAVENDKLVIPSYRTSTTAYLTECGKYSNDNILKTIQQRVSALSWFPVSHMESLNLTRYLYGQKYDEHGDYFKSNHTSLLGKAGQRLCTFFVYLNDIPDDAGGHTIFPHLNLKVKPKKGNALFWLNTDFEGNPYPLSRHLGEIITQNDVIKYGMNIWMRQYSF